PSARKGLLKDTDLFLPMVVNSLRGDRGGRELLVTGRLKPGVTREQANSELEAIADQLRAEHAESNQNIGASVLPLIEATGFNVRVLLLILALVALLVFVVACANVSGVLVAQSIGRRHEMAGRGARWGTRLET